MHTQLPPFLSQGDQWALEAAEAAVGSAKLRWMDLAMLVKAEAIESAPVDAED
jgi:hypothetical protein